MFIRVFPPLRSSAFPLRSLRVLLFKPGHLRPLSACPAAQNAHAVNVISKRRKWVLVLAGVVLAITLIAWLTRDREPSYQGKSLGEWVEIDSAPLPLYGPHSTNMVPTEN